MHIVKACKMERNTYFLMQDLHHDTWKVNITLETISCIVKQPVHQICILMFGVCSKLVVIRQILRQEPHMCQGSIHT